MSGALRQALGRHGGHFLQAMASRRRQPRVAAWSLFKARSKARGVGVWQRRHSIFTRSTRRLATTAGGVLAP